MKTNNQNTKNSVAYREIQQKRYDIATLRNEKKYLQRKLRLQKRYEGKI